ncbi:MAG TPA: hypothetical protein VIM02_06125 [Rhizomicrobium sp.]|jgi:hypothetical protein
MLQNYISIYEIAQNIEALRTRAEIYSKIDDGKLDAVYAKAFGYILGRLQEASPKYSLGHTADMVALIGGRDTPPKLSQLCQVLTHLNDSITSELKKQNLLRLSPTSSGYFEQQALFGPKVAVAFPSCERDIRKAGSCYALEQEDACVHHLMLVLERGLNAMAEKVGVPYQRTNWQPIINEIASKLKTAPKGPERDFLLEVNAQFGFLKDAYRNHSEHARDDPYDMEKALSILNHVRGFMQALQKGGLSE